MVPSDDSSNTAAERADIEVEARRLYWRCRRGMLELDLLLMPYVQTRYPLLVAADQARFRALLEEDDPQLFEWFNGRNLPDDDAALVRLIADIRGV